MAKNPLAGCLPLISGVKFLGARMTRKAIPKATRDALLDEYSYRCAICGGDRPQIHHIDEDHTNNDIENLLPLCPNCHLTDQHNPTRKVEIGKLQLFRKFKDPCILKPQFHPIFVRQSFLDDVELGDASVSELEAAADELLDLVSEMEMGNFYSKRLREAIGRVGGFFVMTLDFGPDPEYERQRREANRNYRDQLVANREAARALIVEQLRYQKWSNEA